MPPIYKAENGLKVIRPFIMVRERQLIDAAHNNNLPLVTDEQCPAMKFEVKMPHARAKTKELLYNMEKENPKLFVSLKASFEHIHESTFLDNDKLER